MVLLVHRHLLKFLDLFKGIAMHLIIDFFLIYILISFLFNIIEDDEPISYPDYDYWKEEKWKEDKSKKIIPKTYMQY